MGNGDGLSPAQAQASKGDVLHCTHMHRGGGIRLHTLEETGATLVTRASPTGGSEAWDMFDSTSQAL